MDDSELLHHIEKLVNEEHELMKLSEQGNLTDDQHVRMRALEISLDQCWDLLRQRRARRGAGLNPEEAKLRDPSIVENYQQ
jgi:Protein of unknown function (DUF2630)